jgi:hypothetical protein
MIHRRETIGDKLPILNPIVPLALGVAIVAIGVFVSTTAESIKPVCVATLEERDHVRDVARTAFEKAFQEHIQNLFEAWMRDDKEQPIRAEKGFQKSLTAYQHSMQYAEKWNPPLCNPNR